MSIPLNLVIEQNANFINVLNVTDDAGNPFDLTNYTVAGQIRKSYASSTAVDLTVAVTNISLAEITMSLTAAQTLALKSGRYVYDVIITSPGGVQTRIVEGIATVTPTVTQ